MWWHDVVVTGSGRAVSASRAEPFDPKTVLGPKGLRYKDRASSLGMSAALLALERAGLPIERKQDSTAGGGPGMESTGVVVSSNRGNLDTVCGTAAAIRKETVAGTSPMDLPNASPNVVASSVAIRFGLKGPNVMLCSGTGSGLEAVRMGAVLIGSGRTNRVVVVGVEPANGFVASLLGLDAAACFDGAAAVLLESRASAARRGAPALARLAGSRRTTFPMRPQQDRDYADASGALGVLRTADAAESIGSGAVAAALVADGPEGAVLNLALERDGGAR